MIWDTITSKSGHCNDIRIGWGEAKPKSVWISEIRRWNENAFHAHNKDVTENSTSTNSNGPFGIFKTNMLTQLNATLARKISNMKIELFISFAVKLWCRRKLSMQFYFSDCDKVYSRHPPISTGAWLVEIYATFRNNYTFSNKCNGPACYLAGCMDFNFQLYASLCVYLYIEGF